MATVIVVPGISGSELYTPPAFFGYGAPIKVWLNYPLIAAGAWRWLELQPDGITPSFPGVGILTPGQPVAPYYDTIGLYLGRAGYDVVGCPCDWRRTIASDADRLVSLIRQTATREAVSLVCHSRGGLVARYALHILDLVGQVSLVNRAFGLGVPHQGSWDGCTLLSSFAEQTSLLRNLLALMTASGLPAGTYRDLQRVISTWPATYELMPSPLASGVDPATVQRVYNGAEWTAISRIASQPWLDAASAWWSTLPMAPGAVEWIDVVGRGIPTPDQLVAGGAPTDRRSYSYDSEGDGVVPIRWANQPGRARITTPTSHRSLVSDGRLLSVMVVALAAGLTRDVVIQGRPLI